MKSKQLLSLLLICLFFALACAGRTPASAVQGFYKAVDKGNIDTAMDFLSQQTIDMIGEDKLRAGLQEATRKMRDQGGLVEVQITSESVTGEVATTSTLLKFGNGTQETEEIELVKERGGWKLQPKK